MRGSISLRGRVLIVTSCVLLAAVLALFGWTMFRQHHSEELDIKNPALANFRTFVESGKLSLPQLINEMTCGALRQEISRKDIDQFDNSQALRGKWIQRSQLVKFVVSRREGDLVIGDADIRRVSALDHSTSTENWTVTLSTANDPWKVCDIDNHTSAEDRVVGWSIG